MHHKIVISRWMVYFLMIKKIVFNVYLFLREKESELGRGREKRRQRKLKQAPGSELSAQSSMQGLNSWTMKSWPELKLDALPTEPPRCPSSDFFFKFVYLFWEREKAWVGEGQRERERERERENLHQAPRSAQSPMWGSISQTVRPWSQPKSRVGRFAGWATQVRLTCPFRCIICLVPKMVKEAYSQTEN